MLNSVGQVISRSFQIRDVRCQCKYWEYWRFCHRYWRSVHADDLSATDHWNAESTDTDVTEAPMTQRHWSTETLEALTLMSPEHRWLSVTEAPKNWKHWHRCHWGTDDGYITDHWNTDALSDGNDASNPGSIDIWFNKVLVYWHNHPDYNRL
jgi:hypothetical protein